MTNRVLHLMKTPVGGGGGGGGTTWNPADKSTNVVLSSGNFSAVPDATLGGGVRSTTSKSSGKLYFEAILDIVGGGYGGVLGLGDATSDIINASNWNSDTHRSVQQLSAGHIWLGGADGGGTDVVAAGNRIGFMVDFTAGQWWLASSDPGSGWGNWSASGCNSGYTYAASVLVGAHSLGVIAGSAPWFIILMGIGTAVGGTSIGVTLKTLATDFVNPNWPTLQGAGYSPWG